MIYFLVSYFKLVLTVLICLFQLSATLLVLLHLSMNVVDEGHAVNPSKLLSFCKNMMDLFFTNALTHRISTWAQTPLEGDSSRLFL